MSYLKKATIEKMNDLRYNNQNLKDWADMVANFEVNYAKKQFAKGIDIDTVLTSLADRITSKMLHPVVVALKEQYLSTTDMEIDRQRYNNEFLQNRKPIADHVVDDY